MVHSHNGLPTTVRSLLNRHRRFHGADLVDAIVERNTDLRDGISGQSQVDLLAILGIGPELAVAVVEGRVDESFGQLVAEWLTNDIDRQKRMEGLAKLLAVTGYDLSKLRYQLFHQTASAIFEAQRYRAHTALLLVHSFSTKQSGWSDFAAFVQAIGLSHNPKLGEILGPKRLSGIDLCALWITDMPPGPTPRKSQSARL
jgi:hypothetical protein